ncbi:MAG: hypothetical protein HY274_03140 [Gammaproteobacteria bacterium]|nr:hypothetical protein [Gammaproteobacteria bacterium]
METKMNNRNDSQRRPLFRVGVIAAIIGVSIAVVIFVLNQQLSIVHAWWYKFILFIWPSYFIMLPFSGPVDWKVLQALGISALFNGLLYSLIVVSIYALLSRRKT